MAKRILVLNGPNLNLLGIREPQTYGADTLADVERLCAAEAKAHALELDFRQSNHEGELVTWIQEARGNVAGLVINPAAYSHTSIAIHDALRMLDVPIIEVHLSIIHAREAFRHHSYVSAVAAGVICGLGPMGYRVAIIALAEKLLQAA
jgi:3-dehydroquinate dehydratase-2